MKDEDIVTSIDSYSDLQIQRDKLKREMKRFISTNNRENKKTLDKAEKLLSKTEDALKTLHDDIMNDIKLLNENALNEISSSLFEKTLQFNAEIRDLNHKREEAVINAKEILIKREISGEVSSDIMKDEYEPQIYDVESKIKIYRYFMDNIKYTLDDLDQQNTLGLK